MHSGRRLMDSQEMTRHIDVMQESMLKMHEHMHKIMDAKTPQERERFMQAHREIMHQHMQAMKDGGMMSQGVKDDGTKNGTGAGRKQ